MSAVNLSNVGPSKRKPGAQARCLFKGQILLFIAFLFAVSCCAQIHETILPGPQPPDATENVKSWIGEYTRPDIPTPITVFEKDGKLYAHGNPVGDCVISGHAKNQLSADCRPPHPNARLIFENNGTRTFLVFDQLWTRSDPSAGAIQTASLVQRQSIELLRSQALAATPPEERGTFKKSDLVELTAADPALHLDIRYATSNDFLGVPVYTQARAFLQRPAAAELRRVLRKLQPLGYGLLIHDGYRPWYVTKIFWDATPPEGKIFVADPAQGSRHNRGCAVDLTLYDLKTGKPVEMTGGYDEMSPRSFPNYPGGTSLQRWHRDLLRRAMESEGFTVYESEWWHFDYKDWHEYGILNIPFEKLGIGSESK